MRKDPGSASSADAQSEIRIPLNKPFIAGNELVYIREAVERGQLAADGHFARRCHELLQSSTQAARVLLTPSCTAALEMAAMLCELGSGDEVILPSYTFVSTASAIVREGATPVFVDIREDTLNIDETLVEEAITSRTRAIFPVHYAGVACEMDTICRIARENGLLVVEDAAQAVGSRYKGRSLGSIGDLGAFSFHETKNFICGEGGALCVNAPEFIERAEIIRDKGTDRQRFFRGETDRYTWQELGSSYVASEICAAFLYAQLEEMESITARRSEIAAYYSEHLSRLEADGRLRLPCVPPDCETNAHLYHLLLPDERTRDGLMMHLRKHGILAVFHYVPLHDSPMGTKLAGGKPARLPVTESVSRRLLRLPFYCQLDPVEQEEVVGRIHEFFERLDDRWAPMSDTLRVRELEWDSRFFGIRVGELRAGQASTALLHEALDSASRGFDLVHVRDANPEVMTSELLRVHRGEHVDTRAEFECSPVAAPRGGARVSCGRIRPFERDEDPSDLVALAPQAAAHSRFRRDPRFPAEWVDRLYRVWIERSLSGSLADVVLVVEVDDRLVGFHTIRTDGEVGRIGLLALEAAFRGRGLGSALLSAGLGWMRDRGLARARVATQMDNPVCRLYERSGYSLVGREEIYHFWPDRSTLAVRSPGLS